MPRIELQPGERFEHSHHEVTTNVLITGTVNMEMNGVQVPLTTTPLAVPAEQSHILINVGTVTGVIGCTEVKP